MATYSSRGPTPIRRRAEAGDRGAGQQDHGAVGAAGSYLAQTYPERVVAGPAAERLHRDERHEHGVGGRGRGGGAAARGQPALTPADAKLVLQITSSRVAGAGLIEAGAGSLNVAGAVKFGLGGELESLEVSR